MTRFRAAPSGAFPGRWVVIDDDIAIARIRNRMAMFSTRDEAEACAERMNRKFAAATVGKPVAAAAGAVSPRVENDGTAPSITPAATGRGAAGGRGRALPPGSALAPTSARKGTRWAR